MNDILRIARLRIALQRAFLGRAILRVIYSPVQPTTANYSPLQPSTAQYITVQPSEAQYSPVQPSAAQCSSVQLICSPVAAQLQPRTSQSSLSSLLTSSLLLPYLLFQKPHSLVHKMFWSAPTRPPRKENLVDPTRYYCRSFLLGAFIFGV